MFQKLVVLKCLRADMVTNAMQDFVAANLGQKFIEPQVHIVWTPKIVFNIQTRFLDLHLNPILTNNVIECEK